MSMCTCPIDDTWWCGSGNFHTCDERGRMTLGWSQCQGVNSYYAKHYQRCLKCGCVYESVRAFDFHEDNPIKSSFELVRRHTWVDTLKLRITNWLWTR